jgi:nucleoside-diphosphate-sugar epimerase
VLVTGATGFVGRQVLEPLRQAGVVVFATARRDAPGIFACDLFDFGQARALLRQTRPDTLLHTAWYVEHGKFWTAPENADWRDASLALAQAFRAQGGQRFIGLGSCAEYATAPDDHPWPETRAIAPETPYGVAKARLWAALEAMGNPQHFETAWARLFHLFGPGEPEARLVPSIVAAIRQGQPARIASGTPIRDFASTWHVGRALAALAGSGATGAFNVGSGQGIAIRDLATRLAAALGRPDLLAVGALPDRPGEVPCMVADVARLRRDAGFTETQDLESEIARLLTPGR